jgi:hypothetical protein
MEQTKNTEPRKFTAADITNGRIYADRTELIDRPLWWHLEGLSQTASGYGAKLTTRLCIDLDGKARRIYVTTYGNAGTAWINYKGARVVIA